MPVWLALAAFVVLWVFDVASLQDWVPVWLPFLIALGLEVLLLFRGRGPTVARSRGRLPLEVDRERYGYGDEADELLLVRGRDGERWIPYAGERGEELDALVGEPGLEDSPVEYEPAPGRPLRRFLLGLGLIAALALVVWFAGNRGWDGLDGDKRAEAAALFSQEASRIVGRPVVIHCDEAGEFVGAVQHADGVAAVGGRLAFLTPERCYDLYRLAYEDDVVSSQTGRAIAVLAHEAWHLRGLRDEGVTECYALQSGVGLGRRLGLKEQTARQLMRQQLVENQLRARGSLEYLVPAECRDGGRLDLDPQSSAFP